MTATIIPALLGLNIIEPSLEIPEGEEFPCVCVWVGVWCVGGVLVCVCHTQQLEEVTKEKSTLCDMSMK